MGDNRFSIVQMKIIEKFEKENKSILRTFICINENNIRLPHPVTNFIRQVYENKMLEPNTVKSYAEVVKGFLNYIYNSVDPKFELIKKNGLSELNANHAVEYVNSLSYKYKNNELKANSILSQLKTLNKFYIWLHKQGIIDFESFEYSIEKINIMGREIERINSPISHDKLDLILPKRDTKNQIRRRKRHDFGKGRKDLANKFIEISNNITPEITLGIAFQIYGGLRKGEVVNLLTTSFNKMSYKSNEPMLLSIEDNWEKLFRDKKFDPADQVKVVRDQVILQTPFVHAILKKHLLQLENMRKKFGESEALFRSYTNGKPIGGRSFQNKFNKVKNKFLEVLLEESKLDDYQFLTSKPWSTHIGRGIFTNILYFNLHLSHEEAALLRGDSFPFSAEFYMEDSNMLDIANNCIEILSTKQEK